MKIVDSLSPDVVKKLLQNYYAVDEDGLRCTKYVLDDNGLAVNYGRLAVYGRYEEWKVLLKLIKPKTLRTIADLMEDVADLERMEVGLVEEGSESDEVSGQDFQSRS